MDMDKEIVGMLAVSLHNLTAEALGGANAAWLAENWQTMLVVAARDLNSRELANEILHLAAKVCSRRKLTHHSCVQEIASAVMEYVERLETVMSLA